jgi:hypothetical protein
MCLPKAPSSPTPSAAQRAAEADAEAQRAQALEEQRRQKSLLKEERFATALKLTSARFGRASLLTGDKGGGGYAAPPVRSLFP